MFDKFEFGDLWKFLASIGLGILIAAIGLPYLVLKDPSGLVLRQVDVAGLTPLSGKLVEKRLLLMDKVLGSLPWLVLVLALLGLGLFFVAIVKWRKRQAVLDEGERVDLRKKQQELRKLTEEQKVAAVELEVRQTSDQQTGTTTVTNTSSLVQQYLAVEDNLFDALQSQLTNAKVIKNRGLGERDYDIVVQYTSPQRDDVIEVKLGPKRPSFDWVIKTAEEHLARTLFYRTSLNRPARPVLLIFVFQDANGDLFRGLQVEVRAFLKNFNPDMLVEFIPIDQAARFNYAALLQARR